MINHYHSHCGPYVASYMYKNILAKAMYIQIYHDGKNVHIATYKKSQSHPAVAWPNLLFLKFKC